MTLDAIQVNAQGILQFVEFDSPFCRSHHWPGFIHRREPIIYIPVVKTARVLPLLPKSWYRVVLEYDIPLSELIAEYLNNLEGKQRSHRSIRNPALCCVLCVACCAKGRPSACPLIPTPH